eukprot:2232501-Lingulodinium_polyedra.AAC.1
MPRSHVRSWTTSSEPCHARVPALCASALGVRVHPAPHPAANSRCPPPRLCGPGLAPGASP